MTNVAVKDAQCALSEFQHQETCPQGCSVALLLSSVLWKMAPVRHGRGPRAHCSGVPELLPFSQTLSTGESVEASEDLWAGSYVLGFLKCTYQSLNPGVTGGGDQALKEVIKAPGGQEGGPRSNITGLHVRRGATEVAVR